MNSEWICSPTDWDGIKQIKVSIGENSICVTYVKPNLGLKNETYKFRAEVEEMDGTITLLGAPFSLLRLGSDKKLIISKLAEGDSPAYTYLFTTLSLN